MNRPNIERFLELAGKATPGPWKAGNVENVIFDAENTEVCFVNIRGGSMYGRRNIPFILNARNEAPDIARWALRLEAEVRELRRKLIDSEEALACTTHAIEMFKAELEQYKKVLELACYESGKTLCPTEKTNDCDKETSCVTCLSDYFLAKAKEGEA